MLMKRALLQIMLAVTLLAAQQLALAHGVWHIQDRLPAGSQLHDTDKHNAQFGACDFHNAFTEVLGAVNSVASMPVVALNLAERALEFALPSAHALLIVPASRGPPALL